MKKTILLLTLHCVMAFLNQASAQTISDVEGNVYETVTIGTQIWMKENLKTAHYRDSSAITEIEDNATWFDNYYLTTPTPAWCYYEGNAANGAVYGKLYNGDVILDSRGVCPVGWHVPTYAEWDTLTNYLGGLAVAGAAMKDTGLAYWFTPNQGATNSSNFTGLPAGYRDNNGTFFDLTYSTYWWSSTVNNIYGLWARAVGYSYTGVVITTGTKRSGGYSIRCMLGEQVNNIDEHGWQENIRMYPNPAGDKMYIDCSGMQSLKMKVYNLNGAIVLETVLTEGINEIDLSFLPRSVYAVEMDSKESAVHYKIVKD